MTRASALWKRLRVFVVPTVLTATLVAGTLAMASPASADPSVSDLTHQIDALTSKLDTLNDQYNTANVNLGKIKTQQTAVNKQFAQAQTQYAALQDKTASYAISAYKGGDVSMMSSMITSGSADTFLDQLTTLDALTGKNRDQLAALKAAKAAVGAQQAKLNSLATAAQTLVSTLGTSKSSFDSQAKTLRTLRAKLDPSDFGMDAAAPDAPVGSSTTVRYAYAQLNKPYVFAADGPDSFDCSGLTLAAYRQVGISLPHSAHEQYQMSPHISRGAVEAGDLVFFNNFGHVGIAISNSRVIHAPTEGEDVKISPIDSMGYVGAARPV
ncbi:C40 family peptidase [Fodinicola feengrottensis]|uniref:C40 family peptidase n=1 Tax=Fodinicola feengrottensis TaxID=435914 RepID=A0ABN2FPE7_9ACTN|nr:NlpC/P60 family protein [Fodinicola feengrottensis]